MNHERIPHWQTESGRAFIQSDGSYEHNSFLDVLAFRYVENTVSACTRQVSLHFSAVSFVSEFHVHASSKPHSSFSMLGPDSVSVFQLHVSVLILLWTSKNFISFNMEDKSSRVLPFNDSSNDLKSTESSMEDENSQVWKSNYDIRLKMMRNNKIQTSNIFLLNYNKNIISNLILF